MRLPGLPNDITTLLLDIDGTLVDSNDAHARAWVDAFAETGFDVEFAAVRPLIGMGADRLLPALDPALSDHTEPGSTISRRHGEIFSERYLARLRPTAGARALIAELHRRGVRCAIATSAKAEEVQALLRIAGVADLIETRSSKQDAATSKPAPDIVEAALAKSGADRAEAALLGDTKYDVAAARNAGIGAIAVRCGGSSDADLADADAIYDDPAALLSALAAPALDTARR
jgi:HAD superfamily hydrolase (TIGR01509 family)